MYGYVTQIAIEDAETRSRPRIILDEDNLFTFSTFFSLFDMYFLLFKCLPFFLRLQTTTKCVCPCCVNVGQLDIHQRWING